MDDLSLKDEAMVLVALLWISDNHESLSDWSEEEAAHCLRIAKKIRARHANG